MNKRQFEEITKWQNETFGKATALSKIAHLAEELIEVCNAIKDEDHLIDHEKMRNTKLEFADCFILLFGAAASHGMTYENILEAIEEKMLINYQRQWGVPDTNGVVNHIK